MATAFLFGFVLPRIEISCILSLEQSMVVPLDVISLTSIAAGKKADSDNSYHGGSRHGGYGHGLAADLVSVKGETRADRQVSSDELWKWIDAHVKEFGIGRPYLDKDPPHFGPIDGKE
jgi:hypothetical protein